MNFFIEHFFPFLNFTAANESLGSTRPRVVGAVAHAALFWYFAGGQSRSGISGHRVHRHSGAQVDAGRYVPLVLTLYILFGCDSLSCN